MSAPLTLIVDDEPDIRELLDITLTRMGIECVTAATLREARERLDARQFNLCLTDMRLPDGDGLHLVKLIQRRYAHIPVAVITAHGTMEAAIEALKSGAFDFVSKPVDLGVLRSLVTTALRLTDHKPRADPVPSVTRLVGASEAIQRTRATIAKLARSQAPVYISGESGSGKELVARLIHEQGPRASHPFVPVNCGAIPAELMESELFGYKKGSFTGATADKPGLFQAAQGGTLFLDEVAELPLHMQVKLLRAIQEKSVRPIGAQQEIAVDVRILSATHKDLAQSVGEGKFRQDLYYRINVIQLDVPPLRERRGDLPLLIDHLLDRLASETGTRKPRLDEDAMAALHAYRFPGNIRELENVLERVMTLSEGEYITRADLGLPGPAADSPVPAGLDSVLNEIERNQILDALKHCKGNQTQAAKLLGLTLRSLRYRLAKLGIE
ncbi:MAG: sigma-54-dependent transcriptional regulator [Gammaproteobacteria bacterium]